MSGELRFSLKAFISVVGAAEKSGSIESGKAHDLKLQALDLMEHSLAEEAGIEKLNSLIHHFNESIHEGAQFPPFHGANTLAQSKSDVMAFQLFLSHGLMARHLTSKEQAPLFNASTLIWRDLGSALSQEEGIERLCELIDETNTLLEEDNHYPKP